MNNKVTKIHLWLTLSPSLPDGYELSDQPFRIFT